MSRTLVTVLTAVALCCALDFSGAALAQTETPEPSPTTAQDAPAAATPSAPSREFRFVSTTKVATMEKELNELAAQGFRLERVAKSLVADDMAALVSREAAPPPASAETTTTTVTTASGPRYEYKVLATRRTGTMDKEITEAAGQGYEIRGLTSMFRPGIAMFVGDETAVVMERPAGETARRFDYKLLSTRREKTMQKELEGAIASGFEPVEMVRGQDNNAASILIGPQFVNTIILGRRAGATEAGAAREYKFLTTTKVSTMEREMNRAVAEGYRFHMGAPDMLMLLSRERGAKGPAPVMYKLLATRKTGTMQKELLQEAAVGYRYLATSNGLGGLTAVLERDVTIDLKQHGTREYKLLATTREKTTQKEISEALAEGYRILDLTTIGEFILILDRQGGNTSAGVK